MKRTLAIVLGGLFVVAALAAFFVGPRRSISHSLAPASDGRVTLDSAARVRTLVAAEDLRIDGNTEVFAAFFGRVRVAPNGNIVVPQGQDFQYRFYSPDGARIATLGRRGSGPGEFQTPETRFGWSGDTLWIWDGALDRVTYATSDGRYIDTERLRAVFSAPRDWGRYPAAMLVRAVEGIRGDEFLVWGQEWELYVPPTWLAMRRPLVAVGPAQIVRRVVGNFPLFSDGDVVSVDIGSARPYEMPLPFRAFPVFHVATDASRLGYLTTHVDRPDGGYLQLTIVATSGDTLVSRAFGFVGEPVPERAKDSVIAFRASRMGRGRGSVPIPGMADRVARWRAAAPRNAQPVYPPVEHLVLGRDSTTWIGLRSRSSLRTWLVLDAAGEPIGSLSLPANVQVSEAERGAVWGTQPDSDDVLSVLRYRVSGW